MTDTGKEAGWVPKVLDVVVKRKIPIATTGILILTVQPAASLFTGCASTVNNMRGIYHT